MQKGLDYTGITIVFLCHDGQGNIVLNKRSQNCRDEKGKWDCGGGGLDFGDTVVGTLKKEIQEEYCTDILEYKFMGYRDVHRMHEEKPTHWIALDFLVHVDRAKVANGEPHKFDAVEWFKMGDLPEPMHPGVLTLIDTHKEIIQQLL
jgi:8-oxo-dGTP diphosphatase